MMRRLVARHEGALPLATVEHIWREIITTFTRMQAPFDVAIDASVAAGARCATSPASISAFRSTLTPLAGPAAVIAACRRDGNDLGIIALAAGRAGPWWRGLDRARRRRGSWRCCRSSGRREGRPICRPLSFRRGLPIRSPPDIRVYAADVGGRDPRCGRSRGARDRGKPGSDEALVAVAGERRGGRCRRRLRRRRAIRSIVPVGGIRARHRRSTGRASILYASAASDGANP